jgi:hypothetical protein
MFTSKAHDQAEQGLAKPDEAVLAVLMLLHFNGGTLIITSAMRSKSFGRFLGSGLMLISLTPVARS